MSSMSCSPRQDADHHRRRMPAPAAPALELLDEGWFFSNTLANKNNKPPLPRRSSGSHKDREQGGDDNKLKASASAGPSRFHRRLLRTPSLPSPRVGMPTMEIVPKQDDDDLVVEQEGDATGSGSGNQQQQQLQVVAEVDDDDLNWSSIYEGVLRSRMAEGGGGGSKGPAPLRRAPSMPVPSSATDYRHTKPTPRTPSSSGEQQRRRAQVRSSSASHHQQPPVLARSKSVFQDKKWRSSGDLESIEVPPSPRLIKQAAGSRSSRPHVPEAWQQRPAALVRVQSSDHARSTAAAEMKDQLRLWAQAVACNVRQEC